MKNIEEYLKKYYNNKIDKKIVLYFLEEKEYVQKYRELTKKINKAIDKDYIDTAGYYLFDPKEDIHYVLIKNYNIDCDNFYILNLYHELSHIETLPYKTGLKLEKNKKKKSYSYCGYIFWREYIAQYEAINKYLVQIDDICFLKDNETFYTHIKKLMNNFEDNLYEIILYLEIKNKQIKGLEKEIDELIVTLKNIKNKLFANQQIKDISIGDLNKIGFCLYKLLNKYYKEKGVLE